MKNILLTFFLLSVSFSVLSYNVIERYEYKGKIKDNEITMVLEIDGETVTGSYLYNKNNGVISLKGELSNGRLKLSESYDGETTGKIDAKSNSPHAFNGVWVGKKEYQFNIERNTKGLDEIVKYHNINSDINNTVSIDFTFLDDNKQNLSVDIIDDDFQIVIEDMNFDGYPDIRISENKGFVNVNYHYFLYDKNNNKYKK
jgi:hypothetical protein